MAQAVDEAWVSFRDASGRRVATLRVCSSLDGVPPPLQLLGADEAIDYGEERVQLLESQSYEYELTDLLPGYDDLALRTAYDDAGVIRHSRVGDRAVDLRHLRLGLRPGRGGPGRGHPRWDAIRRDPQGLGLSCLRGTDKGLPPPGAR